MNLIFNSWLHEKIEDFLKMLESDLAQCNGSLMDISSILAQCMYFGVSFSRIGVDFRAQLAPIFLKFINKYLNMSVIKATRQFETDMENFTLINKEMSSYKRHTAEEKGENENSPPETLLDFNPLAIYCNALLNLFNELRVCSPVAIVQPFVVALEVSLENVAKSILCFYRSEQQAFGLKEKENFLRMCSCFSYEFLPYIQHCISLIFPANNKLVHNIDSITTLRSQKILEPIEHLLPDHKS
jgi:conserved oligomeric Golgi complex subunit 8